MASIILQVSDHFHLPITHLLTVWSASEQPMRKNLPYQKGHFADMAVQPGQLSSMCILRRWANHRMWKLFLKPSVGSLRHLFGPMTSISQRLRVVLWGRSSFFVGTPAFALWRPEEVTQVYPWYTLQAIHIIADLEITLLYTPKLTSKVHFEFQGYTMGFAPSFFWHTLCLQILTIPLPLARSCSTLNTPCIGVRSQNLGKRESDHGPAPKNWFVHGNHWY